MIEQQIENFGEGTILHTSWGYDMIINEFCIINSISPSGKSVMAQMIGAKTLSGDPSFQGYVAPDPEIRIGKPFRLMIREWSNGRFFFVGSYPFVVDREGNESKHRASFSIADRPQYFEDHLD